MQRYLLVPRIKIRSVNAHSAAWIVNTTPVMAINMFAHNLGRNIGTMPDGVAIIHHDQQMKGGWLKEPKSHWKKFYLQQRRGASFIDKNDYASRSNSLSLQPTASCDLTITLVFRFSSAFDSEAVEEFLHTAKIAGGQVDSFYEKGVKVFNSQDALINDLPKSGYWIVERTDLLEGSSAPLDTLLDCLTVKEKKEDGKGTQDKQSIESSSEEKVQDVGIEGTRKKEPEYIRKHPWLVPTVLGYAMVTDFAKRENVRTTSEGQECMHAFAEPLVGPVQYVSTRGYQDPLPFWSYQWLNEKCFIVNQTKGENQR